MKFHEKLARQFHGGKRAGKAVRRREPDELKDPQSTCPPELTFRIQPE
ncbi:hypothetical protein BSLA_02r0682 [Burkholderia stabilis]|nr:hypothetical protein BSLA_02r0682 [Burkholderia stabilis]